jgi:hypothetical protein
MNPRAQSRTLALAQRNLGSRPGPTTSPAFDRTTTMREVPGLSLRLLRTNSWESCPASWQSRFGSGELGKPSGQRFLLPRLSPSEGHPLVGASGVMVPGRRSRPAFATPTPRHGKAS